VDGPPSTLEGSLDRLDTSLAAVERALKATAAAHRRAREAARMGNVRDLPKLLGALAEATRELAALGEQGADAWDFRIDEHLASDGYFDELLRAIAEAGVAGARQLDGRLYCYPFIIRVEARDQSLRVGRKPLRAIRPSHVADMLRAARAKPDKENLSPLLHAIEGAYLRLTGGETGRAVAIADVHAVLTLLPGSAREYPLEDLVMDLYRLDLSGPHLTKSGRRLDLPASTSAKGGRGIRFATREGEEKVYSAIRFEGAADA